MFTITFTFDCWPSQSYQFTLESKWTLEPHLQKFPPGAPEISHHHGRTTRQHNASSHSYPRHRGIHFPALSMALSYKTTRLRRKHYMAARPTFRICFSTSPVSSLSLIEHITCTRLLNAIPTDRTSNTGLQIVVEHGSFRTWDCATVVSTSF